MPTVTVSPRAQYRTVSWPPLGVSHPPLSETQFQKCQKPEISPSPPLQAKRRPAIAMMNSEDEEHTVDPRRVICSHKRQKTVKIRPIEIHDRVSIAGTESKIFQHLQEQRMRLPIARGGSIHNPDESDAYISPLCLLGRESLLRSIALNDVTIILGETGSGKTTRMLSCSSLPWSYPSS